MFCGLYAHTQSLINLHTKQVTTTDTVFLDSLSIVQNTICFYDTLKNKLNDIEYKFDFEKSAIIFDTENLPQTVIVEYKTFPINFFAESTLFDKKDFLISDTLMSSSDRKYVLTQNEYNNTFTQSGLSRKGSISRGISFGNAQDVIVNSSLNLQLNGKLTEDLNIAAAINDNNIPIQPDGTSQQLQEFDKVFIELFNDKLSVVAGDFELKKTYGYFSKYLKKAQGAKIEYMTDIQTNNNGRIKVETSVSGAVAKGKLRRQEIQGIEGNQGPYKLTGENNETYIVILAGTERVYIDGQLMLRGAENDYTIDYNLGEISFTVNQPINKDKRIIVEFEYSDRNYSRFLTTTSNRIKVNENEFYINFYDESDNKNQAFDQVLSNSDKALLSNIGDDLNSAVVPSFDSLMYSANEIRYQLIDTIVDGVIYDSVFIHSTNPENAFYQTSFSFVGPNKGNYKKGISAANGRVYEWVAPINGVSQGDYMPLRLIITPKKTQLLTIGGKTNITKKTKLDFEFAYSKNDLNTFSNNDSYDDNGYASQIKLNQNIIQSENTILGAIANYEFMHKSFQAIENFRATEFTRDWNIENIYSQQNENLADLELFLNSRNYGNSSISTSYIDRGSEYYGWRNNFNSDLKFKKINLNIDASLLDSEDSLYTTKYLQHKASLSRELGAFVIGVSELGESNMWNNKYNDSISLNSFNFNQYEAFVSTSEAKKNKIGVNYKYRKDDLPANNKLANATIAQDFNLLAELNSNSNHRLKTVVNYRNLQVNDSSLYQGESENNMTGRIEYNMRLLKGVVTSSTLYEIGSGLERETEFSYIEVAAGQGVYTWTDYNNNGVQELDEFEVANFIDEANYIRILIPTTEYIKTYTNTFNQTIKLLPEICWKNKKGFLKFMSRFSNQFAYNISQKNTSSDILEFANPFNSNIEANQLVSLNSSFRNNFSFNRGNPKFGVDYIVQSNSSKILLVSGFDSRANFSHGLLVRYNINEFLGLKNTANIGDNFYSSEFFQNKNYDIENITNDFEFSFQPNFSNSLITKYSVEFKNNTLGGEELSINDVGLEYRLNSLNKGSLSFNFNYIYYRYNADTNSPIAYEMLQGFMPGTNLTWAVIFQRQLANGLQINLNYTARKTPDTAIVHTGGVQVRAFF